MRAGLGFFAILRQEYQQGARARLRENAQICVLTPGDRSEGTEIPFTLLPSRCGDFRRAQCDLCLWHPPPFFLSGKKSPDPPHSPHIFRAGISWFSAPARFAENPWRKMRPWCSASCTESRCRAAFAPRMAALREQWGYIPFTLTIPLTITSPITFAAFFAFFEKPKKPFAFSSPGSFELDKNQPKCARGGAVPLALALSLALTLALALSLTLTLSLTLVDKCPLYSPDAC